MTTPRGLERFTSAQVIAALGPRIGPERAARLDEVAAGRLGGVVALLEDLRDPHNAGAALRSCEAMGVMGVHVVSTVHRFRTAVRVTQGCEKWLDVERWRDPATCVQELRRRGIRLFAGVADTSVRRTIADLPVDAPIALAFGNEHTGLSPSLLALCDGEFTIPMYGCSRSLNVSVSVAVTLHVVSEARRRAVGGPSDLDPEAAERLRARYYALDVRGAAALVARALEPR